MLQFLDYLNMLNCSIQNKTALWGLKDQIHVLVLTDNDNNEDNWQVK